MVVDCLVFVCLFVDCSVFVCLLLFVSIFVCVFVCLQLRLFLNNDCCLLFVC